MQKIQKEPIWNLKWTEVVPVKLLFFLPISRKFSKQKIQFTKGEGL